MGNFVPSNNKPHADKPALYGINPNQQQIQATSNPMSKLSRMTRKNKNNISNAHDQFFRTAMANKQVAREFLKAWLPGELCQLIDFEELKIQPRSQINEMRQESEVDVLFKTTIDGNEAYLYLFSGSNN